MGRFKIEIWDYRRLETAFNAVLSVAHIDDYREKLRADPRVKDIEKRIRWDVFYAIPRDIREPIVRELYAYLNDANIDAVLKQLMTIHYNQLEGSDNGK